MVVYVRRGAALMRESKPGQQSGRITPWRPHRSTVLAT
jgi:hypothetical protein